MVTKRQKFRSGQEAQLDSGASLGAADRALFLPKRRPRRRRADNEAEALLAKAHLDAPAAPPPMSPSRPGKRARLEAPPTLSRIDRTLEPQAGVSKRLRLQALQKTYLEAPAWLSRTERLLARPTRRRHRLRSAQQAQLDAPSVLAEVDRILLVGTDRPSVRQAELDRRHRFQALQQAQLEGPAVLGKAERVLLGRARLYYRQRFRATQAALLDAPSSLGEVDRMLLIGARKGGWRRRLRSLGLGVSAWLDYTRARLRMRQEAGQRKQAARGEGLPAVRGPAEETAEAIASATRGEQPIPSEATGMALATREPTEAAIILARAFGREDLAGQVPIVTAALTELGAPRDEFGLTLRIGSLAPKTGARASEFTITGLGLAELSHGLSRWLREANKTDIPIQVIDDGSGKIKVLIS